MWPLNRSSRTRHASSSNGRYSLIRTLARPIRADSEPPRLQGPPAAELQQDVQRAATAFADRVSQAGDPLEKGNRPVNEDALLRRILLYNAAALEIATGPYPKVNALDMVVFAILCRGALERHWIPNRFGDEGLPLVEAFICLERDAWETAGKFLDQGQQADLRELVSAWQDEHPGQYRVEGVRFQEFSEHAGRIASARHQKASGMLGQVRSATMAADHALLISERAVFLANRMPFLLRAQARVGVQETLNDSLARLHDVEALLGRAQALRPLLGDIVTMTNNATAALRETRELVDVVEPHVRSFATSRGPSRDGPDIAQMLASADRVTESSLSLVRELRGAVPDDPARTFAALEQRLDRVLRRWILYVVMAAAAWTAFFWFGYFLVRRL